MKEFYSVFVRDCEDDDFRLKNVEIFNNENDALDYFQELHSEGKSLGVNFSIHLNLGEYDPSSEDCPIYRDPSDGKLNYEDNSLWADLFVDSRNLMVKHHRV